MADIKVDVEPVQKALAETSLNIKSISLKALRVAAQSTANVITQTIRATVPRRSGELAKGFRYKRKSGKIEYNVFPKSTEPNIFEKSAVLSYGYNGATARAKSWTVKPYNFVQTGRSWADSGNYEEEMQKATNKELDKYWSN